MPAGRLIIESIFPELHLNGKILGSLVLSILVYALLLTLCLVLKLDNDLIAWILRFAVVVSLAGYLRKGFWRELGNRDVNLALVLVFLYSLLSVLVIAVPAGDLQDVIWDKSLLMSSLPIDSIIPYNVSRYILEGLDPNVLEISPGWKLSDRGPLAGMLNAVVFLLLGLRENTHWMQSSPGLYFVYQSLMTVLNALSILAVWFVGLELFGRKAGGFALLLLSTTYFYFLNTFFVWPKFFMAFFVLSAVFVGSGDRKSYPLSALFFVAAILSHNSALPSLVLWLIYLFTFVFIRSEPFKMRQFSVNRLYHALRPALGYLLFVLLGLLPWIYYKGVVSPPSPRLPYMHFFCIYDADISNLTLGTAFKRYMSTRTWSDVLQVRGMNLAYPFNPLPFVHELRSFFEKPFLLMSRLADLTFFQLFLGIGIPTFVLFVGGIVIWWKKLWVYVLCGLGAVIGLALVSGCYPNTVNHQWAYTAFLVIAIGAGSVLARVPNLLSVILAALIVGSNLVFLLIYLLYRPLIKPFLHFDMAFLCFMGLCAVLFLYFVFRAGMMFEKDEDVMAREVAC